MVSFLLIFSCALFHSSIAASYTASINSSFPADTVNVRYFGVTLDSSMAESANWNGLNFSSIVPLARALGLGYFRFGGTMADFTVFDANATTVNNTAEHITLTGAQVDTLYNLVTQAGWRLIFDLNLLLRDGDNWNFTNAQEFITYVKSKGYELDFELGNEPDLYKNPITGAQLAQSYKDLKTLLKNNSMNSIIIGPSTANSNPQLLKDFFTANGSQSITILSFHHYYMAGATANLSDFLSPTVMDGLIGSIEAIKTHNFYPIWLGETSSAWNGGAVGLSDTYAAGFLWLDKLGLSALHGLDNVLRQDIFGGNYGLLNRENQPNPDYWLSLLYKKLIGLRWLVVNSQPADPTLRLYASMARRTQATVVYGMKLDNNSFTIDFTGLFSQQVSVYVLQGQNGVLNASQSTLNGNLLNWATHQPLNLYGVAQTLPITLPGYSQFYIVVNNQVTACGLIWYRENIVANKCLNAVFNDDAPFFSANLDCATYSNNASMLSIDSAFENNEIISYVSHITGCDQFYIGLIKVGNNWVWANGDKSGYINWMRGYPTNDPTKNCATYDKKSGQWMNVDCDSSYCYICQMYT